MKVIFLDNDGVICLGNNWGSRFKKQKKWGGRRLSMTNAQIPLEYRFDNFDEKAIKVLNRIIEQTDAEIVVSSDWRYHATLEELGDYYISQGITKRPIATTDTTENIDPEAWKLLRFRADLELERAIEINYWLSNHPEVTNWVAVDDLNMSVDFLSQHFSPREAGSEEKPGLTNFVHTPLSREGIKQNGVEEKILKFLNA
jgi:hypothetical protein